MPLSHQKLVQVGRITGSHGTGGDIVVESWTEIPADLFSYRPLLLEGRAVTFDRVRKHGKKFLAHLPGIESLEQAKVLSGKPLTTPRHVFPELTSDREAYICDLLGSVVEQEDGQVLGKVVGVENFGAGDLLDVLLPSGKKVYVPYALVKEENSNGVLVLSQNWPVM